MSEHIRVQRKKHSAIDQTPVQRNPLLLGSAAMQQATSEVQPLVQDVLTSGGQPLAADTRAFMEPRFNHDFSQVRVHTDERAAASAQVVNARAYTVGQDVVFGTGQYTPETS